MSDPYRTPAEVASPCPRCDGGLVGTERAGLHFDECTRCEGVFCGHATMRRVVDSRDLVDNLRSRLPRTEAVWVAGRMYVKCPVCSTLMNRKQYATGAQVVIDVCREHGLWFDAGELPRVLDFLVHGGLERAAKRDAEAARESERRERDRQLSERLEAPRSVGWGGTDKELGRWLIELLWQL